MKITISKLLVISAMTFAVSAGAQTSGASDSNAAMGTMHASDSSAAPTRSAGRYVDDKTISTRINAAFLADTDLKSSGIKVRTYKGVVTLTGHTTSQEQIDTAKEKVHAVDGVKVVKDHIKIAQAN